MEDNDHRKIGKDLSLFMFSEEAPGMPFYLPNGQIIMRELEGFLRPILEAEGYQEIGSPFIMSRKLWEQSGHWDHFHRNMYFMEDGDRQLAMKPMNCPGHMLVYKNELHSYRDLPIRISEFGQVHRNELHGALNGLMRARTFKQDDAHIFVRPDQIEKEISYLFDIINVVYPAFGLTYEIELSTRPEDHMGESALWDQAEQALENALNGKEYTVNKGDGAFYGPKIDFHVIDALGRRHQCATIQLDFQMPEKFDLSYIDESGQPVRPVIIHRAIYGSLDRFFGILIEHYQGVFPLWLAPVQVQIIPVADRHHDYAIGMRQLFRNQGIRAECDLRNEKVGYKIRESAVQKHPYAIVVGDKEVNDPDSVKVRERDNDMVTNDYQVEAFIYSLKKAIAKRM